MTITWAADVLRSAGLPVYEDPGWLTRRSRAGYAPQGIVWHHTATSLAWLDGHVLALLRNGRRDLSGPLSQLGLERDGTWVCIASGRANHNGYGTWGNDSIGVEAYNSGLGEPWPKAQVKSYEQGTAAICKYLGWDPRTRVKGHKETDPTRKIDPTGINMHMARTEVGLWLAGTHEQDPFMALTDPAQEQLARRVDAIYEWLVAPAGARIVNTNTGETDPSGVAVSDVWRWTRESAIALRDGQAMAHDTWRWTREGIILLRAMTPAIKAIVQDAVAEAGGVDGASAEAVAEAVIQRLDDQFSK